MRRKSEVGAYARRGGCDDVWCSDVVIVDVDDVDDVSNALVRTCNEQSR
jgi:hypothetical protein